MKRGRPRKARAAEVLPHVLAIAQRVKERGGGFGAASGECMPILHTLLRDDFFRVAREIVFVFCGQGDAILQILREAEAHARGHKAPVKRPAPRKKPYVKPLGRRLHCRYGAGAFVAVDDMRGKK